MMKKHISITRLLERLKLEIDFDAIDLVDYWEADLCAIGLKKGNRLIYISTFNYLSSKEPWFDVGFEILDGMATENLKAVNTGRNVSEAELINEIRVYLSPDSDLTEWRQARQYGHANDEQEIYICTDSAVKLCNGKHPA